MSSIPNLTNNIIQQQNIVINQVPLSHAIMTNVNATNGIPIATALTHAPTLSHTSAVVEQPSDIKSAVVMEGIPIAGASMAGLQSVPVQASTANAKPAPSSTASATESMQVCRYMPVKLY